MRNIEFFIPLQKHVINTYKKYEVKEDDDDSNCTIAAFTHDHLKHNMSVAGTTNLKSI